MQPLLKISKGIDWLNEIVGKNTIWLILASTVISAVNAIVRKAFNYSSNGFLEIQWYLFAGAFMLASGYALLHREHVRVDVVSSKFSKRSQIWMDIFGFVFFLGPVCIAAIWFGTPFFLQGLNSGEMSSNAGGLIRWPVYLMIPLGFSLLLLQGVSEVIKRFAFLQGLIEDPTVKHGAKTPEEELAESLRLLTEAEGKGAGAPVNTAH